jgi:hypothetical protein
MVNYGRDVLTLDDHAAPVSGATVEAIRVPAAAEQAGRQQTKCERKT